MLSTTDTTDCQKLEDYFYRANYSVLKDSNVFRLSNDMKDEFDDLCVAYADKFPIASGHVYACRLNDEDGEIIKAEVAPTSLLYSMPDEWQKRFCLVLDALNEIEWDDDHYHVILLDPKRLKLCDDPFDYRHKRWESDTNAGGPFYPYGMIEGVT